MKQSFLADVNLFIPRQQSLDLLSTIGPIHISQVTFAESRGISCKSKKFGPLTKERYEMIKKVHQNTVSICLQSGGKIIPDYLGEIFYKSTAEKFAHVQKLINYITRLHSREGHKYFHRVFQSHIYNVLYNPTDLQRQNRGPQIKILKKWLKQAGLIDNQDKEILSEDHFANAIIPLCEQNKLHEFYKHITKISAYEHKGQQVLGKFMIGGYQANSKFDLFDFYQCLIAKQYDLTFLTENDKMERQVTSHPVVNALIDISFENIHSVLNGKNEELFDLDMSDIENISDTDIDSDPEIEKMYKVCRQGTLNAALYSSALKFDEDREFHDENISPKHNVSANMTKPDVKRTGSVALFHSPSCKKQRERYDLNQSSPMLLLR